MARPRAGGSRGRRLPTVIRHRLWEPLLAAAPGARDRALIAVGLYGALRISEALGLDWPDVDFAEEQLHIRHGKGDKEAYVYLHPTAAGYLEAHRADHPSPAAGPVFLSERKTRLSRQQAWRIIKAAGAAAGCGDIWPHVLRHSAATRMLEKGARLDLVQAHLRHAELATTARYLHLANPELKQAAQDM